MFEVKNRYSPYMALGWEGPWRQIYDIASMI